MGKVVNRAKMSVSGTPGTGTITLGSAVAGYQTFAAAGVNNGDVVSYVIEDGSGWEIGQGTYTASGTTLARTTVLASSNSGSAISATSGALVFISPLAADIVNSGSNGVSISAGVASLASAQLASGTGFSATSYAAGTKSSGTFTPDSVNGNVQDYTNGGAHTLAPQANPGTIIIECTNASAGALTTSGFDVVTGDTYSASGTKKHIFFLTRTKNYKHLHVVYITGT